MRPNAPGAKESQEGGRSWMLEHVTEVVYLATQIQITEQMEACMKSLADGNKDAIQVIKIMWCGYDEHVLSM